MRVNTQPFIGRMDRRPTRNPYNGLGMSYLGPFDSEEAFDDWCLSRISGGALARFKWRRFLAGERKRRAGEGGSGTFVLTHGDFTPRNILIHDGIITCIIDWERSGFFSPSMPSLSSLRW